MKRRYWIAAVVAVVVVAIGVYAVADYYSPMSVCMRQPVCHLVGVVKEP